MLEDELLKSFGKEPWGLPGVAAAFERGAIELVE
jgi:hypothetical protein